MDDISAVSEDFPIFAAMTPEERETVAGIFRQEEHEADTEIFHEGDPGGAFYLVVAGAVEVNKEMAEGVERRLLGLGPGGVFGELSVITGEERSATARAVDKTTLLVFEQEPFSEILLDHPGIGVKLLRFLVLTTAERLYVTTELYRRAIEWSLNISGAVDLTFHELAQGRLDVNLELVTGNTISGQLLRVQQKPAGDEFLVKSTGDELVVVPYHAVASMSFTTENDPVLAPDLNPLGPIPAIPESAPGT